MTGERAVIAIFQAHGWRLPIYGANVPVHEQMGWQLYQAEIRLLAIGGQSFKSAMMSILRREGDPYAALINTAREMDEDLRAWLSREAPP